MTRGSGVPRQLPTTAFGGGIWCRFAAGVTLPGPLREALSRHPRSPLSSPSKGTENA
jgi:hypothetical protein